jgi:hypothetical protein
LARVLALDEGEQPEARKTQADLWEIEAPPKRTRQTPHVDRGYEANLSCWWAILAASDTKVNSMDNEQKQEQKDEEQEQLELVATDLGELVAVASTELEPVVFTHTITHTISNPLSKSKSL